MYKMLNVDNIVSNKKKNSSENDDWPFRMLIIGPSGSGKTNTLLHLIDKFHPIDKIFILIKYNYCTKEPYSFMMVDTRPTACVTFKKNVNEPVDLRHL